MIFDSIKEQYPYFYKASTMLEDSCFFFKTVLTDLKNIGLDYDYCEDICEKGFVLSDYSLDKFYQNLHSLVEFSLEFLRLQVRLVKTGKYLYSSFAEVERYVYNDPNRRLSGPWYMMALYFSQVFWVTHYKVNKFFLEHVCNGNKKDGLILEAPSGTGVFISNFLTRNPSWYGTALDLSDSAIEFTQRMIDTFEIDEQVGLCKHDFFKYNPSFKYDIVLCGEFLEHLERPEDALNKLYSFVKDDGCVFLTVAVYASMIDHIYLYRNVQELRQQIYDAGFEIDMELVQNVFKGSGPRDSNTPINYSAILVKDKK